MGTNRLEAHAELGTSLRPYVEGRGCIHDPEGHPTPVGKHDSDFSATHFWQFGMRRGVLVARRETATEHRCKKQRLPHKAYSSPVGRITYLSPTRVQSCSP